MCNIKDQIVTLLKQRHHSHKVALDQEKDPRSKHAVDLIARIREDSQLIELIDSLPEEDPSEDLEEAAARYERENRESILSSVDIVDAFIAGAEWQRVEMMKDAAEGEIVKDISNMLAVTARNIHLDGFKFGDKVKIIIVKK